MQIRRKTLMLAVTCVLALFLNCVQAAETSGTLIVDIEGFADSEGYAMVAVFSAKEAYKAGSPRTAEAKVKVADQKARAVFNDLKYGVYAVAMFHDRNANGKMDKNSMGIPKESYGHSNNARGIFGPPDFAKAKFDLDSSDKQIEIKLK
jgi:uncharacterized protein (DUF2141 family)